jgi:hypothetical protein
MKSLGATRRRNGFGSSQSRPVVINTKSFFVVIICLLLAYFVAQYRLMEQAYINVTPPIREDKRNNEPASRLRSSSATNDNHRIGAEPAPYISVTPPIREDKHSNETTSLLRSSNATNDNSHQIGAEPAPKKNGTYDPRRILPQPPRTDEHKVGYNPGNYTSDTNRDEWAYNLVNYTSNSFLHTVDNYFDLTQQNRSFFPIVPELPPLEVMRAYIQEHSQQHLENVWRECGNQNHHRLQLQLVARFNNYARLVSRRKYWLRSIQSWSTNNVEYEEYCARNRKDHRMCSSWISLIATEVGWMKSCASFVENP